MTHLKEELTKRAIAEIELQTNPNTEQYLAVLQIDQKDGRAKVARVDCSTHTVYFSISEEDFFFVVTLTEDASKVKGVGIESSNNIYFSATSKTLTFEQLSKLTMLKPLAGWSRGDLRRCGKNKYNFSRLTFNPFPNKAYEFEAKLKLLLTELEKNEQGIKALVDNADGYIGVCRNQYIEGNIGFHLESETINRLSQLNLAIDIDQYVGGGDLRYYDLKLDEAVIKIKCWPYQSQLDFCEKIPFLMTLVIRDIWMSDKTNDAQKIEAIKWLNEFNHRLLNITSSFRKNSKSDAIQGIHTDVLYYQKQNAIANKSLGWVILTAFDKVLAKRKSCN
jgi:hypothetical protein